MRHRKSHSKLSMDTSHRKATLRNMVKSLLKYQKIETIRNRAKEARRLAERLISMSKTDSVASRRAAFSILTDRDLVAKLFKEIAPLFKARNSGFTRIIPLGFRRGDGADMVILELTEKSLVEKLAKKKREAKKAPEAQKPAQEKTASPAKEKHAESEPKKEEEEEAKRPAKKEELKAKTIPKSKPSLEEEKRAERARTEDKKIAGSRNFMKNLRGLFRKRGDR